MRRWQRGPTRRTLFRYDSKEPPASGATRRPARRVTAENKGAKCRMSCTVCGRYVVKTQIKTIAKMHRVFDAPLFEPRYNVAPTQTVPIVRAKDAGRESALVRWGLIPAWARDTKIGYRLINARADTVASKPSFRSAFKRRRCLVPADGFYDW